MKKTNKEEWLTNRQQKLQPRLGKGWCGGCDQNLVGHGCKCEVCGFINGRRRLKK